MNYGNVNDYTSAGSRRVGTSRSRSASRSGSGNRSTSYGSGSYGGGFRGNGSYGSPRRRRRRRRRNPLPAILIVLLLLAVGVLAFLFFRKRSKTQEQEASMAASVEASLEESRQESIAAETTPPETTVPAAERYLAEAEKLALQYDYDAAIACLQQDAEVALLPEVEEALARYEEEKAACVRQEPTQITHIFFHSLIVDPSLSFDGERTQDGYNQVMTTVTEFNRILDQMYERGYVLVSLHDISYEVEDTENGGQKMVWGDIMLPAGKKAFVMSQDDLCYYEYQKGDGLATRMIVGEDGRPTCEYTELDGTVKVGAYDMVPILDAFIDEHPDFSYRGAKAAVAFTGYNGILGYRTDESYDPASEHYDAKLEDSPNENLAGDRAAAVRVLKALVDDGYELASHSWGHLDMGKISYDRFKTDSDRWERNVNSLIREATGNPCDILIYPKGADIGSWKGYASDVINSDGSHADGYQKFCYLHNLGFRYYCNVDSSQYFVQKGNDYFRMGRRNVDGDRMWRDLSDPAKAKLGDLIDVAKVFDAARPTPVPGY